MITESQQLENIKQQMDEVWEEALAARDGAQLALEKITKIKSTILARQLEIQQERLAELQKA
jgi:hypothetical protein